MRVLRRQYLAASSALQEQNGEKILIARRDPVTGDLEDFDGNPIDCNHYRLR